MSMIPISARDATYDELREEGMRLLEKLADARGDLEVLDDPDDIAETQGEISALEDEITEIEHRLMTGDYN